MSRGYRLVAWGLMATALFLAAACAEKITDSDAAGAGIQINQAFRPLIAADALNLFIITIDAPNMTTRSAALALQDGQLVGQISVPYGDNRHFVLEALDSTGTTIYRGETTINIARGQSVQLTIDLFPVVACLNITPHYTESIMGSDVCVEIHAWNIDELSAINFNLDFATTGDLLLFDSLVIGVDLSGQPISAPAPAASTISVDIAQGGTSAPVALVDSTGYGKLATVYFHSHTDTQLSIDTALLSLRINSVFSLSQPMSADTVFTDAAMIELTR